MTPAEQTAFINKRIEEKIQAKENGNSYNLAMLADERWDLVKEMLGDGKSIDQIADILELLGERRKLFVDYKILVNGAESEEDIKKIIIFIEKIPPNHRDAIHTILMGVHYSRWYDSDKSGRYYFWEGNIISFVHNFFGDDGVKLSNIVHEWGHGVDFIKLGFLDAKLFWFYHLVLSWGNFAYATEYSEATHWEEFAEIYESWVIDTKKFFHTRRDGAAGPRITSLILRNKILIVARMFVIEKEGKLYLRVYRKGDEDDWEKKWESDDVLLPDEVEEADDLEEKHILEALDSAFLKDKVSLRLGPPLSNEVALALTLQTHLLFFDSLEPIDQMRNQMDLILK